MRFISPSPGYKFLAIRQKIDFLSDGLPRELAPSFLCEFSPSITEPWEQDIARKQFTFRGVPYADDGVSLRDVIGRVSVYDTDLDNRFKNEDLAAQFGMSPAALKEKVEKRLLDTQRPDDHILAAKPKLDEPWIGYDKLQAQGRRNNEMVAEKIVSRVQEDGYTPEQIEAVLRYELSEANRPEVVKALQALVSPEDLVTA